MKRLTLKEAHQYISMSDEFFQSSPSYYTLSEDVDGWETVTYYTNKKIGMFSGKEGNQWVYILSNSTMPDILKIGYTKLDPSIRSKQISNSTGVPLEFQVEWAYKCFNGEEIEKETHIYLQKHRLNKSREFFKITLEEAIEIIERIGNKYK